MLLTLFITFFKIGLFTFGGGYAMIANVREEVVERKNWLSEEEFLQVIAIAESTPGPIAINMATFVGYKKHGFLGSVAATGAVVLPSLIIIYIISRILDAFMANEYVTYAFTGIKCAVAFLILKAGLDMLKKMEKKWLPLTVFGVILTAMILFELFSVSFSSIFLILFGGIVGIIAYTLCAKKEDL
jgi:chromate transporter